MLHANPTRIDNHFWRCICRNGPGNDAQKKSDIAIAKVVQQEIELYKAENGEEPNDAKITELVGKNRAEIYQKHKDEV